MTESPRRTFIGHLLTRSLRFGYRRKTDNEINHGKDGHSDIEHYVHIVYLLAGQALADDGTHQHRRQGTAQRIEGTADHVQLVTTVTAAAKEVEHRINHGVQHAHTETTYQRAGQVHIETVHCAAEPLDGNSDETKEDSRQGRLLVTVLREEVSRRNTHNQIR